MCGMRTSFLTSLTSRSAALQLQVVALNALAHLSKSDRGGAMGDSYTMGVVSALCDSQDPDVRSAAVKAIGRCEADSKALCCMCVLHLD